mmetsp:Transcript_88805/g.206673  ORF Transcript_88805/g.206673 Transcript_88805/m.206673 type:complete len:291 (-) Transcript_88805:398-1270(-)
MQVGVPASDEHNAQADENDQAVHRVDHRDGGVEESLKSASLLRGRWSIVHARYEHNDEDDRACECVKYVHGRNLPWPLAAHDRSVDNEHCAQDQLLRARAVGSPDRDEGEHKTPHHHKEPPIHPVHPVEQNQEACSAEEGLVPPDMLQPWCLHHQERRVGNKHNGKEHQHDAGHQHPAVTVLTTNDLREPHNALPPVWVPVAHHRRGGSGAHDNEESLQEHTHRVVHLVLVPGKTRGFWHVALSHQEHGDGKEAQEDADHHGECAGSQEVRPEGGPAHDAVQRHQRSDVH